MLLFLLFSFVTQLQFNKSHNKHIDLARNDLYLAEIQDYNYAVQSNKICIVNVSETTSIKIIFNHILAALIRNHPEDTQDINALQEEINQQLPTKTIADCPPIPSSIPEKPKG